MGIVTAPISGEEQSLEVCELLGHGDRSLASFNILLRHEIMVKMTAVGNEVKALDKIKSLS